MKNLKGDWKTIAEGLPVNGRTRTQCSEGCGSDNSQLVSHNPDGYSRYCFRCNSGDYQSHGLRSISLINQQKAEQALVANGKLELPKDFTLDIPKAAALWYWKFGISGELAYNYNIGYSPELDRIVMPVYENGNLVAIQMRAQEPWRKPKYLNIGGLQMSKTIFESGVSDGCTVIVEDILSAIKVGRVHHATSILGTNMTDYKALKIADRNNRVIVWLDGDKAGIKGAKKAKRQLELLDVHVTNVCTPRDPKTYSLDEIKEIINGR